MRGVFSLCLFFLGAITSLISQASAVPSRGLGDFHLGILGAGSGDMIAAAGNNRALQSSTVRSFDITITFVNSINLPAGYPLELTFYGPDGLPAEPFTVYAPSPGSTEFYEFCLDSRGWSSITSGGSDMDDTVLIIDIEPNVCPCGVSVCFDPHLQGLRGQHVEWTGVDGGWYALVKDDKDDLQVNVRTTAPMPEDFPDRQFITGVSVISQGHSLVVEVKDPYTINTEGCSDVSPCLADGGLRVSVDGEVVNTLSGPTKDMQLPGGIELSASNLPAECREFGGRKVWARMQKEMERNLRQADSAKTFEEWVLSFTHMVAPDYCASFVANNDLSKVQSDQALLRIETPTAAVRLSAGVNHRRAGKTDRYGRDLPELDFWQMGVGVEGLTLEHKSLTGLLGETARVVVDAEGHEVMEGAEALHGTIEDYRVSDVEGTDFALLHN